MASAAAAKKTLKSEMTRLSREYHTVIMTERNATENKAEILEEAAILQAANAGVRVDHFVELLFGDNGWGYVVREVRPVLLKAPDGPHDPMSLTWHAICELVNDSGEVPARITIYPGGSCGGCELEGSKVRGRYKWVPAV